MTTRTQQETPQRDERATESHSKLFVAKRKVAVEVCLADRSVLNGELYADIYRLDGSRATLLDRLNDDLEEYLPLAFEGQHILVHKPKIVTIDLDCDELPVQRPENVTRFTVHVRLTDGTTIDGVMYARLPPSSARVLDYLNRAAGAFVSVIDGKQLTLVNRDYVVSVTERVTHAQERAR